MNLKFRGAHSAPRTEPPRFFNPSYAPVKIFIQAGIIMNPEARDGIQSDVDIGSGDESTLLENGC